VARCRANCRSMSGCVAIIFSWNGVSHAAGSTATSGPPPAGSTRKRASPCFSTSITIHEKRKPRSCQRTSPSRTQWRSGTRIWTAMYPASSARAAAGRGHARLSSPSIQKTVVHAIMTQGNRPTGNSTAVAAWNTTAAATAARRVRRASRRNGRPRSNSAAARLPAIASPRLAQGQPSVCASQMRSGSPSPSQSPCSFAIPAKK